jgi:hypothetical protein
MPTLLDNLETRPAKSWNRPVATGAAERLRTTMAAVRVAFTWWGVQRALTADQKAQAAQEFDAEGGFLSAGRQPRRPPALPLRPQAAAMTWRPSGSREPRTRFGVVELTRTARQSVRMIRRRIRQRLRRTIR